MVPDCSLWKVLSNGHKSFDILIIFGGDVDNTSKDSKKVVFGGATSMLNFRDLSKVKKTSSDGINRPPLCLMFKFCPGLMVIMAISGQSEVDKRDSYWKLTETIKLTLALTHKHAFT